MDYDDLEDYAGALQKKFSLPGTASPEDQLKPHVAKLIQSMVIPGGAAILSRTETHLPDHKVRPDLAFYVGGLISGYIELKAPGLGADAPRLKGKRNREQWAKLKGLPNLIYTDGREWALYRMGQRMGPMVRFKDDPTVAGVVAIDQDDLVALDALLQQFLAWEPIVPHRPTELAAYLAPLARFLRSEVLAAVSNPNTNIALLANEWRQYLFPHADNAQFADAYAQTVTYAMLLARLTGAEKLDSAEAAEILDKGNGLLATTLRLLGQSAARAELRVGFELLQRSLEALNPTAFLKTKPDLWLYFYEDFLSAYDPKLRNDYGVYYTPREVVEFQVRLASELLEKRFGKKLGFADNGVVFLDPAVGTGTYLVATVKNALDKVRDRSGVGAVPGRALEMANNMYGFEVLVGPYSVAHLRLTQAIEGAMNEALEPGSEPAILGQRLKVYLADTLESPYAAPPGGLTLTYKTMTEEHESARAVKQGGDILVCLGNPPYDRQQIEQGDTETQRKGGWVRFGDLGQGKMSLETATVEGTVSERTLMDDFTEPASLAGAGIHIKNLYNDYIYFWRWALWRLFEQQTGGGVISFITASSYLAGPGFIGVREVMRRTFDEMWVIDLGGDNLGARRTPNVFNIQTPVAICIGVRGKMPSPKTPAKAWYTKITGHSRAEKLSVLDSLHALSALTWRECATGLHDPFLPVGTGDYFRWPAMTDIMPLVLNGAQFKRTWPIGETEEVLSARWDALVSAKVADRHKLFRETGSWKITKRVRDEVLPGFGEPSIFEATAATKRPASLRYAFRSFDRQYALYDFRLGDRLRKPLFLRSGPGQIFFTTLLKNPVAEGPAVTCSAEIPDLHHFRGSFGGKGVIPLYRDEKLTVPNITKGLLTELSGQLGIEVTGVQLAAYVMSIVGCQDYTRRFWNELETPGPRVPITRRPDLFLRAVALGEELIWLETFAQRYQADNRGDEVPAGMAKNLAAVSASKEDYPETFAYDAGKSELRVGSGRFGPVSEAVWSYEVSGLKILDSWLGYRMKERGGKSSSDLDNIRPSHWSPKMTDDLLELLWTLERVVALEPSLIESLDAIAGAACFAADDLPTPTALECAVDDEDEDADDADLLSIIQGHQEDAAEE